MRISIDQQQWRFPGGTALDHFANPSGVPVLDEEPDNAVGQHALDQQKSTGLQFFHFEPLDLRIENIGTQ
jgi:hypothetical protein